ncbi:2-hydroxyacid dehydrogenase [Bordetella genomosp. 4]|uniref:Hydroxyacid dehydrogenase n=1 Tax=Bordetella genomosp. 4 TaxID=463044 RepID=A0A261U332_9BORD|nr:2-hydroxyacid dehydrogenase [Bordetella genomosp. 4]OZI49520.1 hydroxyacid dehydrogenase [Bordetella genomosp. 4]OZI55961.1 hydroxyacid dehydrogenase [Bordetella genomosp. 4]
MKPHVLKVAHVPHFLDEHLNQHFQVHTATQDAEPGSLSAIAPDIRALVANGESTIRATLLDQLPALELIAVFGVGYDGVDVAAAQARGIAVTNTPDVLTDDVADMGMALLLTLARRIVEADAFVRAEQWPKGPFPWSRSVSRQKLGIVGLGRIGSAFAQRAAAFGMDIAYTGRTVKSGVPYRYQPSLAALAEEVDFLAVCAHGGESTRGLIDAKVLDALGPQGLLINIGRGSVVDEAALIQALQHGTIAGAGLDVFAHEPNVPAALRALPNVVLTPHAASATTQTRQAMSDLVYENLAAHFAGRRLVTPVSN